MPTTMTSDSRHQLGASGVDRRPVRGERCQRSLLDRREDLAGHLNELVADRQRRVWCPEGAKHHDGVHGLPVRPEKLQGPSPPLGCRPHVLNPRGLGQLGDVHRRLGKPSGFRTLQGQPTELAVTSLDVQVHKSLRGRAWRRQLPSDCLAGVPESDLEPFSPQWCGRRAM